jgi:hypothetical protein
MHEASVQMFEEYRLKYDGSVDRALAETIQAIALFLLLFLSFLDRGQKPVNKISRFQYLYPAKTGYI